MQTAETVIRQIREVLTFPLFTFGQTSVTTWTILYLIILLILLFYVSNRLKGWIADGLLARRGVNIGVRQAIGTMVRYVILAVGFIVVLQTAGIDLSTLTIFAGAVGIGVGFGLQNIASNFVSGLIILLERPIKVGDRIEVDQVNGDVVNISARATTIITNDNIAIIVPNSKFVGDTVINWSYATRDVRFNFPVGVAYGADPEVVREVLLEVAGAHGGILQHPKPDVLLDAFGDNAVTFILRVWTREYTPKPGVLRSELYYAISRAFKERGIEMPFPQRDIHIRSGTLQLRSDGTPSGAPARSPDSSA